MEKKEQNTNKPLISNALARDLVETLVLEWVSGGIWDDLYHLIWMIAYGINRRYDISIDYMYYVKSAQMISAAIGGTTIPI